jgi:hypothetical protein
MGRLDAVDKVVGRRGRLSTGRGSAQVQLDAANAVANPYQTCISRASSDHGTSYTTTTVPPRSNLEGPSPAARQSREFTSRVTVILAPAGSSSYPRTFLVNIWSGFSKKVCNCPPEIRRTRHRAAPQLLDLRQTLSVFCVTFCRETSTRPSGEIETIFNSSPATDLSAATIECGKAAIASMMHTAHFIRRMAEVTRVLSTRSWIEPVCRNKCMQALTGSPRHQARKRAQSQRPVRPTPPAHQQRPPQRQ